MNGARTRPYRRRRRGPVTVVVSVLAVVAAVTWTTVLVNAAGAGLASCPEPTAGSPPGEVLSLDALATVAPVPPAAARTRVLNAGGQRGQANLVAAQLGDLGFVEAAAPGNDPFYPDGDMECVAQLRFGATGEGAASTLSLVLPCAELVRDGRPDDTVDIAVGTAFGDLNPARAARDALGQLTEPAAGTDGSANADPSAAQPPQTPVVDPVTLRSARDATC